VVSPAVGGGEMKVCEIFAGWSVSIKPYQGRYRVSLLDDRESMAAYSFVDSRVDALVRMGDWLSIIDSEAEYRPLSSERLDAIRARISEQGDAQVLKPLDEQAADVDPRIGPGRELQAWFNDKREELDA
jgi:hypothetical protein